MATQLLERLRPMLDQATGAYREDADPAELSL
jgi:hypothetical protein